VKKIKKALITDYRRKSETKITNVNAESSIPANQVWE
jgi:hypothetical protein